MDLNLATETLIALVLSGLKDEEIGHAFLSGKITVSSG